MVPEAFSIVKPLLRVSKTKDTGPKIGMLVGLLTLIVCSHSWEFVLYVRLLGSTLTCGEVGIPGSFLVTSSAIAQFVADSRTDGSNTSKSTGGVHVVVAGFELPFGREQT